MKQIFSDFCQMIKEGFVRGGMDEFFSCFFIFISLLIIVVIIWGLYSLTDYLTSHIEGKQGKIIDKKYVGEINTTGTAMVNTVNGPGIGITSSHQDEQYLLFVNSSGTVFKLNTSMQYYYHCKLGDSVTFKNRIGGVSNSILSSKF